MLSLSFLPLQNFGFNQGFTWVSYFQRTILPNQSPITENNTLNMQNSNTNWMEDFSISVGNTIPHYLGNLLFVIWLMGIACMIVITLYSNRKLNRIRRSSLPLQNRSIKDLYEICQKEVGVKEYVPIFSSAYVPSPFTVGLLRPCIIIPIYLLSEFHEKDIRFILLHELLHYKYRDNIINNWMCFLRIIYWFNPFVWYALKVIRTDREIACDTSVLQLLDQGSYSDYGHSLLNFAQKLSYQTFSSATSMGGSNKQIKKRILNIISYRMESKWIKLKSILVFLIVGAIMIQCTSVFTLGATKGDTYQFTSPFRNEDLSSYFEGYDGCFVMYDKKNDEYYIYNKTHSIKRISPYSTYKIFSGLFALEEKVIIEDASLLRWDNIIYPYDTWNQDHTLNTAMTNSVNWYFNELDNRVGLQTLQQYFKRVNYGNGDLSGGLSNYWLESTLKISPMEQVQILNNLYHNKYAFNNNNVLTIIKSLKLSESEGSTLFGKTGTGMIDNKNVNGWFVGFVEANDNTYFFATNIQNEDSSNGSTAAKITLSILDDKHIYSAE
jgi:bla regulator protein BlaR1